MIEWYLAFGLLIGLVMVLLLIGTYVAFAFFAANLVGVYVFLRGDIGLSTMSIEFVYSVAKFSFVPVALFILMGEILFQSGMAARAIKAIEPVIKNVPGRLSVVSIASGTVFSALTGSTIANTAIMGSVMLPEMQRRKYHPTISMGPIMAVGGIAMLIPPSALAVLLASLAEGSIKDLLLAGIVPGILMAISFAGYIVIRCWVSPELAPTSPEDDIIVAGGPSPWRAVIRDVLPLLSIFVVVVGSIIGRIATPEEAAALGCIASVVACIFYRQFEVRTFLVALRETARVTVMILFVISGSYTFSQVLQISGATTGFLRLLDGWDLTTITALLIMIAILLVFGAFMDQVSMMLLTLPFFVPLAMANGIDLLWLMVIMLLAMEISLLTPPFGLLLFVMKGVAPKGTPLGAVYRAALPFLALELFVLGLLVFWPQIATGLPNMLR
jgi:tripartite ATP-independent transporter DctM subunit